MPTSKPSSSSLLAARALVVELVTVRRVARGRPEDLLDDRRARTGTRNNRWAHPPGMSHELVPWRVRSIARKASATAGTRAQRARAEASVDGVQAPSARRPRSRVPSGDGSRTSVRPKWAMAGHTWRRPGLALEERELDSAAALGSTGCRQGSRSHRRCRRRRHRARPATPARRRTASGAGSQATGWADPVGPRGRAFRPAARADAARRSVASPSAAAPAADHERHQQHPPRPHSRRPRGRAGRRRYR